MKMIISLTLFVLMITLSISNILSNTERIWADSLVKTVPTGQYPIAFEYNPTNHDIYVADYDSDRVSVIDDVTNEVIDTIRVGDSPRDIVYAENNNKLYVGNVGSGDISVIDGSTNKVIETFDVRGYPYDLEYNPVDNNIYIMNSPYVTVWDTSSDMLYTNIEVGLISMRELMINPINGNIYLSSYDDYVYAIDRLTNNIDAIEIGSSNYALEYNPENDKIYVSKILTDEVTIIDGSSNEIISTVKVGDGPFALEYNSENNNIYVANRDSDDVSIIDGNTNDVIDTIIVGNYPFTTLEYNPHTNKIYVANWGSQDVSVIDGNINKVTDTIPVGADPFAIEYNPSNNYMYVGNTDSDTVSIINSTQSVIVKPIADAGLDQSVNTDDKIQLDGSNSSDPNGSPLTYQWNQTIGPEVMLSDSTSSNPSFTAPETNERTDLTFQLTVTNEEGIASEPDEVTITVNPINNPPPPPPPNEEPKTISDLIRGIIQNPLNVTNSLDSANEIKEILTDNNRDNDQLVCNLLESEDEQTSNIRDILDC